MAILIELRVIPIGTGSTSLSNYVAKVIEIIKRRGYRFVLGPMGTSIELENFTQLSSLLEEIVQALKSMDIKRIAIDISIDIRLDKEISLESKVKSVESKITINLIDN